LSKKELVIDICDIINCTFDTKVFSNDTNSDNDNGTVTKLFLELIYEYLLPDNKIKGTKNDYIDAIFKLLDLNDSNEYIGDNGQVSKKFLEDIIEPLRMHIK